MEKYDLICQRAVDLFLDIFQELSKKQKRYFLNSVSEMSRMYFGEKRTSRMEDKGKGESSMTREENSITMGRTFLQKKTMIWESARLTLATLRDYVSDCMDSLGFLEEALPDSERWRKIRLSAEVAFHLLEGATDLIDTAEGDAPPYMENLFECMQASGSIPLLAESNSANSPEIIEFIDSLTAEQKISLLQILKRLDTNAAYWDGVRDGVAIRKETD